MLQAASILWLPKSISNNLTHLHGPIRQLLAAQRQEHHRAAVLGLLRKPPQHHVPEGVRWRLNWAQ